MRRSKINLYVSFALNTVVILSRSISCNEINLREPFMSLPFQKGLGNHALFPMVHMK